jgi:hypothetical protein
VHIIYVSSYLVKKKKKQIYLFKKRKWKIIKE